MFLQALSYASLVGVASGDHVVESRRRLPLILEWRRYTVRWRSIPVRSIRSPRGTATWWPLPG
ncbi:hypothetical protein ACPB67_31875 [Micromonospora taraxaci]|uniref:hypothetical protein n=1 Tax=Micromonospora taraxaci TaxID=1316803 RepID=UPI003C2C31C2